MSLENRKRQYRMFMERGEIGKAKDQIKAHPELLKEIEAEDNSGEKEEEVKTKGKR